MQQIARKCTQEQPLSWGCQRRVWPVFVMGIAKKTLFGDMTGPRDDQSAEALRSLGRFRLHSDSSPVTDTDWWRDSLVSRPVRSIVSSFDHR